MHTEVDADLHPAPCDVALKEWGVTCRALAEGRQIVLLRKGGLLDEDGVFHLEYSRFYLQPTALHQDESLVKPAHRDLFAAARQERATGENREFITLRLLAEATQVFALGEDETDRLCEAPHIWSNAYLDTRFNYKPEHPLLCVLLRVYQMPQAVQLPMQAQWAGCRSWIELPQPLALEGARPVLAEAEWQRQRRAWQQILQPAR
ncbi:MAG TPA: DUF1802 family protein [Abditibacteriaceae bacterium]|jgi:hypothetical protein